MDYVKICPTCKESIAKTPLVDTLVTFREDLTQNEIYEQGWHKKCYPSALLAACEAALGWIDQTYPPAIFTGESGDEGAVGIVRIREQARAAIAEARGEAR